LGNVEPVGRLAEPQLLRLNVAAEGWHAVIAAALSIVLMGSQYGSPPVFTVACQTGVSAGLSAAIGLFNLLNGA